ncbi:MAG: hypothetical protein IJT54_04150 [Candidatus Methanomethylophilaceae archaeon]|nr:hypothetical protein [Candidatus Methanomethylophilaceae archaeon]
MKLRRKPDYEAESIRVTANKIDKPEYVPKSKTHGGNRTTAKGDIKIVVNSQHPGQESESRPKPGTVLHGDDDVIIEARSIIKGRNRDSERKEIAVARQRVEIFGKLRRLLR